MRTLIRMLAQALVDNPEEVSVAEVHGKHTTVFELRVAKNDLGKIIGKQGRNADAIRTIVNAISAKEKKRTLVEIIDDIEITLLSNAHSDAGQKERGRAHVIN